jgi:hypothetical protein
LRVTFVPIAGGLLGANAVEVGVRDVDLVDGRAEFAGELGPLLFDLVPLDLERRAAVDLAFLRRGVTFTVYNNSEGTE